MKKYFLAALILIGAQVQAQVNWCDSISYTTQPSQTLVVIGDAGSLSNIVDSIDWIWQACNSTTCYSGNGANVTFPYILSTDTVKLCYTALIYVDTMTYFCNRCDSIVYDQNSYSWVVFNTSNPTGIQELSNNTVIDNKIYDIYGRELLTTPKGVMYIQNRKKYIKL